MNYSTSKLWAVLLFSLCLDFAPTPRAQTGCAGIVDPNYAAPHFDWAPILAPAPDGVVAAIGHGLVRLDRSGALDPSFGPAVKKNSGRGTIYGLERDQSGRYVIWGDFDTVNYTPRPGIARILPNGDLDGAFAPPVADWKVAAVALQLNHGLVLGIKTNNAGTESFTLVRLDENGALDSQFNVGAGPDGEILSLAAQPDNKILVGGSFKNFDGQPRRELCRLLPNGALDPAFAPQRLVPVVHGLKALPDGKFFTYWRGALLALEGPDDPATNSIVRYNMDGSVDPTFAHRKVPISDVEVQSDGKYLIAGVGAMRLLSNGQRDPTFYGELRLPAWTGDLAYSFIALGPNEEIYVTGNGWLNSSVARLLNDQDNCVPIINFERDQYIANEAEGTLSIPLLRTGNVSVRTSVTLNWWPDFSTNLVFNPGEDRIVLQFPLGDDHILESSRAVDLYMADLSEGATLGARGSTRIIVTDASSANAPGSVREDVLFNFFESGAVMAIAPRPDGKIYAAGRFTKVNGVEATNLIRFNADYTIDASFQFPFSDSPWHVAVSGDKLYVSYYTESPAVVHRLLASGAPDPSFAQPAFQSPYQVVLEAMAVQPDGKLLIAGPFTNVNGVARVQLARLNTDGSLDLSFDAGFPPEIFTGIKTLAILEDGSILAGGSFPWIDGVQAIPLMHFSSTGERLDNFKLSWEAFPTFEVRGITPEPGGGALITGFQHSLGMSPTPTYAARFTAAGEIDSAFNPEPNLLYGASFAARQPDGKIVIYGGFAGTLKFVRLFSNGKLDPSFFAPLVPYSNFAWVYSLAALANGDILAGGGFETFNHLPTRGLALLRGGTYSGPGVFSMEQNVRTPENAGAMKVKIFRRWSTSGAATIRFKTRDAMHYPIAGVNYVAVDTLVQFADGQSEAEVSIPLIDTPVIENYLQFEATIEAVSPGAAVEEFASMSMHFITDDQPSIALDASAQGYEGSTYRFYVQYRPPYAGPVTVEIVTEAITAIPNVDFIPLSKTLTLSELGSYEAVEIALPDDAVPDPGKSFRIRLRNPQGASLGEPSSSEVVISDNANLYRISPLAIIASQEEGSVTLQVSRADGGGAAPFRLTYKTEGGTALPGVEYVPQQGEVNFNRTDLITIPLLPNHIVGPPTTFNVKLSVAEGEIVLTEAVSTITLRHPAAVVPAGSYDPSFKPVVYNGNPTAIYNVAATPEYLYVIGRVPDRGDPSPDLHRYQLNGAYDAAYDPEIHGVSRIFPLPNGKLLVLSDARTLSRLNADGSLDASFQPKLPGLLDIVAIEPAADGKILVAGGIALGSQFQPSILQLLPNGEIDPAFARVAFDEGASYLNAMIRQPNGAILIGGPFTGVNGNPRPALARLLPNGALDPSFNPSAAVVAGIYNLYLQPDGKIVASGSIWKSPEDAETVLRFNEDGSLDTSWALPFTESDDKQLLGVDAKGRAYFSVSHVIKFAERSTETVRALLDGSIDPTFYFNTENGWLGITPQGLFVVGQDIAMPVLAKLFLDPPPMIAAPELLPGGRAELFLNFPASVPYVLERTSDFQNWTSVAAGSTDTGYARIEIEASAAAPQFFRLRQL